MDLRARLALSAAAIAAAIVGVLALVGGSGPDGESFPTVAAAPPTPLPVQCVEEAPRVAQPPWVPDKLLLPPGSYPTEIVEAEGPVRVVAYAVPNTLDELVAFIVEAYPDGGWELRGGEREPGEAETVFIDADTIGQLRARAIYCDPGMVWVAVALAPREAD